MFRIPLFILVTYFLSSNLNAQSWEIEEVATLPEAVTNNAVVEGFLHGVPYIYSFSGLDQSKLFSGIHLKSWRYNTLSGQVESIPSLPDDMGKIAAGANRIGSIIYIIGGYSVFSNGNEVTSAKVHRYDIPSNSYLADGAPTPVAVDDQVQAVWRDSLIFLITGWSNTTNVPDVQVYDPSLDTWQAGTSVPNNFNYNSFGASGVIIEDTIFYFGGAAAIFPTGNPFPIQNGLRKGVINPDNPTEITWSIDQFGADINGYRMGATTVGDKAFWLGGSSTTYNFDGIAYNGSGGVEPLNRSLYFQPSSDTSSFSFHDLIPMDLRGVASVNDSTKYLMGGMLNNQLVSNKIFRLTWKKELTSTQNINQQDIAITLSPNPVQQQLKIAFSKKTTTAIQIRLYNTKGQSVQNWKAPQGTDRLSVDLKELTTGLYFIQFANPSGLIKTEKIIIGERS